MSNIVHVITDESVMVLDTTNGKQVKFFAGDSRYSQAIASIQDGFPSDVFMMDTKHIIEHFIEFNDCDDNADVSIQIRDGEGIVILHAFDNMEVPLQHGITKRIMKMSEQGFDSDPLMNFIAKLYSNPSKVAVDELYLFIEANELPITEDGDFIAYKIVQDDYLDIYSKTMDNSVGSTLSVPRHMVDTNRNNTCSYGLHFCSKEYLQHYGSSARGNDRCVLVKINPADVVSIPSDYNNAKGRTWQYTVVGEVDAGWRTSLPTTDFTSAAVVSNTALELPVASKEMRAALLGASLESTTVADRVLLANGITNETEYSRGYKDGWIDWRNGEAFWPAEPECNQTTLQQSYNSGYDAGYRDNKNHRAKQVQF